MSSKDFTKSSQFISKCAFRQKKLHSKLKMKFAKDLKSLRTDNFGDLDIHVANESEDFHLRHRCILAALCPSWLQDIDVYAQLQNLDLNVQKIDVNVQNKDLKLQLNDFPNKVTTDQKQILRSIYHLHQLTDISANAVDLVSVWESGRYSDVTFEVNGDIFKCHKCILSSRCEYFARMFGGNWLENDGRDSIELKNMSSDTFSLVLQMVYTGYMDLDDEEVCVDVCELLCVSDM